MEIAHALEPDNHEHGERWQQRVISMGRTGEATWDRAMEVLRAPVPLRQRLPAMCIRVALLLSLPLPLVWLYWYVDFVNVMSFIVCGWVFIFPRPCSEPPGSALTRTA